MPDLSNDGGLRSVAQFVKDAALETEKYELKVVSLATSSNDPFSLNIVRPSSWMSGVRSCERTWDGLQYVHVGAQFGELEFQRYRRRKALTELINDCDVIQVVGGSPAWANAVIGLGKPVALQVATRVRVERRQRDAQARGLGGWWRKAMTEVTDKFDDQALKNVDAIQVENTWMLEYARRVNGNRELDLRYAPPGVNADIFRPLARRELKRAPYILCVGRLDDPRKNIGLLLDAYTLLPAALRATVGLVLAGSSKPSDTFWNHARTLGVHDRIRFIDKPTPEILLGLYQEASVFALPSDEEGLGLVILEAMACAVPAVSTRSGGPDGIITDGLDGYLVPLNDAKAMSSCLRALLADEASNIEMGRNARRTVEKRYDKKVARTVFVEMWDRLAHRTRSA